VVDLVVSVQRISASEHLRTVKTTIPEASVNDLKVALQVTVGGKRLLTLVTKPTAIFILNTLGSRLVLISWYILHGDQGD
jgi:hypothetical protein